MISAFVLRGSAQAAAASRPAAGSVVRPGAATGSHGPWLPADDGGRPVEIGVGLVDVLRHRGHAPEEHRVAVARIGERDVGVGDAGGHVGRQERRRRERRGQHGRRRSQRGRELCASRDSAHRSWARRGRHGRGRRVEGGSTARDVHAPVLAVRTGPVIRNALAGPFRGSHCPAIGRGRLFRIDRRLPHLEIGVLRCLGQSRPW